MGLRETLARCFGRRPSRTRTIGEEVDRHIREAEKLLPASGGVIDKLDPQFTVDNWSRSVFSDYIRSSHEEKVCPFTKQLIVDKLRDIAADKSWSIRQIINAAFADGIKDDYDLLDRLQHFDNISESKAYRRVVEGAVP